ncbi:unnamed protein product, partial [marine sediment metagenome]
CIQGPSYPSGDCQNATYDGEVLTWENLLPGSYNVTETDPGTQWAVNITGSPATVVSLETATANVTNSYGPGSLNVTKYIEWGDVTSFNSTFEICIQGPSYPSGDCQSATYDGEVLTWENLLPGSYNVTETDPGTQWAVNITGSPATVVSLETASANVTNTYGSCEGSIEILKLQECEQGCTPGYWKVPQHFEDWPAGYNTTDKVGSVFNFTALCVAPLENNTLLDALYYNGGSGELGAARILLRAAVAAVLNAVSLDVNYPRTVSNVVT